MEFYVYELKNSLTGDVFYVGKGMRDRMYQHRQQAVKGEASKKGAYIRELLRNGGDVIASKVECFDLEDAAYDAERALISIYGLKNLVNIQAGGRMSRECAERLRQNRVGAITAGRARIKSINSKKNRKATWVYLKAWLEKMEPYSVYLPRINDGERKAEQFRTMVREMLCDPSILASIR